MKAIIKQNKETRICDIQIGQKVKHPEGFWGTISMFGEDGKQQPRILMTSNTETDINKKRGAYPDELILLDEDFEKGEKIY